jgi:hypothetical protein
MLGILLSYRDFPIHYLQWFLNTALHNKFRKHTLIHNKLSSSLCHLLGFIFTLTHNLFIEINSLLVYLCLHKCVKKSKCHISITFCPGSLKIIHNKSMGWGVLTAACTLTSVQKITTIWYNRFTAVWNLGNTQTVTFLNRLPQRYMLLVQIDTITNFHNLKIIKYINKHEI